MLRRFWPLLLLILILNAAPAAAHGYIVRSIPEDRATLERPPTRLQYWFSESLEPAFSSLILRDSTGAIVAEGGVDADNDSLLRLRVPPELPDGAYVAELRPAFASDGHVVAESRVFFVGQGGGDVAGTEASDLPVPLEIVWKAILFASLSLLLGVHAIYLYALIPAWGSARYPAGMLPPRVMQRLNRIAWVGIFGALLASAIGLIQQSMVFFNVDAGQVISAGLWQVVRIGSRFGDVWNVRVLFLIVLAALHFAAFYYRERAPRSVRAFWSAGFWVTALIIGAQAVNSHAAGSLVLPWLAVFMHWLHSLAVAVWAGGVVALTLVLGPALVPYEGEAKRAALLAAMHRISRLMVGALALVITTGIYNSSNWFYTTADLSTTYGGSLALKLLLVGMLLYVGALHHVALRGGVLGKAAPHKGLIARTLHWAGGFSGSIRLEALVAVLALCAAALLSATPIPEPEFAQQAIDTPTGEVQLDDLAVSLSLIPGGPGVNTYDAVVRRDGAPFEGAQLSLQLVDPDREVRSPWQGAEPVDAGLYVSAGDEIDEAGRWWALVDVSLPDEPMQRAFFEYTISEDAAVIQSRPPTLLGLLSLLAVMLVIGWLLMPGLRAGIARLDLNPVNVLAAGGAIVVSVAVIIGGIVLVNEQQRVFNETLNPPPEQVNPIPPDAASLARGQALYEAQCIAWQQSSSFQPLLRTLDTLRDEELVAITREGWRELPACTEPLTDTDRWDVANYVRTLRTLIAGQGRQG